MVEPWVRVSDVSPLSAPVGGQAPGRGSSVTGDRRGAALWLLAALCLVASCFLPITGELFEFPAQNGVPAGFIRIDADAWGRLRAAHSAFEGVSSGGSAPRYGIGLAACALALAVAAIGARWPRLVPGHSGIGGLAVLVGAGATIAIRCEELPDEPVGIGPGVRWQFGWGLWLLTFALAVGGGAWLRGCVRARRICAAPTSGLTASSVWEPAVARRQVIERIVGALLCATLLFGAGVARAYTVVVAGPVRARATQVRYSFDGWGHGAAAHSAGLSPTDPAAQFGLYAAHDAVLVALGCAAVVVAVGLAAAGGVAAADVVVTGLGAVIAGAVVIQLTVTCWQRPYFEALGQTSFGLGPSGWILVAALAATGLSWLRRMRPRRSRQASREDAPAGLDVLR